jgi:hypothetical protein
MEMRETMAQFPDCDKEKKDSVCANKRLNLR